MDEETNTVVITDIFGKSSPLKRLCTNLQSNSSNKIQVIDPYGGQFFDFTDEQHAYQHFTESGGVEAYAKILLHELTAELIPTKVIAFSVGASALWTLSENEQLSHVKQATCFYGSQIRYHQNIEPLFPIELIFPAHEIHFDVNELHDSVKDKEQVTTIKTTYLHGFMNELSSNFNLDGYHEYEKLMRVL